MSGKAAKIRLTERQYQVLQQIRRSTTASKRLLQRVNVILMAFSGELNETIAAEVDLTESKSACGGVGWQQSYDALGRGRMSRIAGGASSHD